MEEPDLYDDDHPYAELAAVVLGIVLAVLTVYGVHRCCGPVF